MNIQDHTEPLLRAFVEQTKSIYERSNLTKLQLLYWIGQKLHPASPFLNTILGFTITSELNPSWVTQAFRLVVQSSDSLRTIIQEVNGIPRRSVLSYIPHELEYIDLSTESDGQCLFQDWLKNRSVAPLDITYCLYDVVLVKLAHNQFFLYLNFHHLITDAGSSFLVYRQIMALYEQLAHGATAVPPSITSFETYVAEEHAFQQSSRYRKAKAYWEQNLGAGFEPLKFYGKTAVKKSTFVKRHTIDLGIERSQKLRHLANQKDTASTTKQLSLTNLFVALTFTALHHLTGNQRIAVLMPFHNRPTPALRNTVGLVMELCPIPIEITKEDTFLTVIQKVNQQMQKAILHYQYGSEIASLNNKFDVLFNYHDWPILEFQGHLVQHRLIHSNNGSNSFALHVYDRKESDTFLLSFDFHEDIFSPDQQAEVIEWFIQLIDTSIADVNISLSQIRPLWESVYSIPTIEMAPSQCQEIVGPRDMLEFQLYQIWRDILGIDEISIRHNFFALGGNSWQAMRLFVKIEQVSGQYLPLTTLLETGTIEELANLLRQKPGDNWSNLLKIQTGNGHLRPFFCIPGAGGNGLVIARIARHLGVEQPVYTFLLSGLVGEQLQLNSVEQMGSYYLATLLQAQPQGPYLIGGYSAGAIIAFEVAQQLINLGHHVDLLAIIDAPAQGAYFLLIRQFIHQLAIWAKWQAPKEKMLFLQVRDFLFRAEYQLKKGIKDKIQRSNRRLLRLLKLSSTPQPKQFTGRTHYPKPQTENASSDVPADLDELGENLEDARMRAIFAANDWAVRSYIPQPYSGHITLFKSTFGYQRSEVRSPYPDLGWRRVAKGGLDIYEIPGTHASMVREPDVRVLGDHLRTCLNRAHQTKAEK